MGATYVSVRSGRIDGFGITHYHFRITKETLTGKPSSTWDAKTHFLHNTVLTSVTLLLTNQFTT